MIFKYLKILDNISQRENNELVLVDAIKPGCFRNINAEDARRKQSLSPHFLHVIFYWYFIVSLFLV